jgi:hypothetical protein
MAIDVQIRMHDMCTYVLLVHMHDSNWREESHSARDRNLADLHGVIPPFNTATERKRNRKKHSMPVNNSRNLSSRGCKTENMKWNSFLVSMFPHQDSKSYLQMNFKQYIRNDIWHPWWLVYIFVHCLTFVARGRVGAPSFSWAKPLKLGLNSGGHSEKFIHSLSSSLRLFFSYGLQNLLRFLILKVVFVTKKRFCRKMPVLEIQESSYSIESWYYESPSEVAKSVRWNRTLEDSSCINRRQHFKHCIQ